MSRRRDMDRYVAEDFIGRCNEVIADCDEIPDRGSDFAESVAEKIADMRNYAGEKGHVTQRMWNALENMADGVAGWLD